MKTVLTPADWTALQEIVNTAADLEGGERTEYLERACDGQPALRSRVESLLKAMAGETTVLGAAIGQAASIAIDRELPRAGARIGPYCIERILGRGGMGVVYEAVRDDDQYYKRVAIKVVATGLFSESLLLHFRNERQILANLDHPNIARLLDGGTVEGAPYVVMEYVDGSPIDEYCREHNLSVRERLSLFRQLCDAVAYAHRNLVVHRDIKPGNVLVSDRAPKLLDFGIAKLLEPDGVPGSTALTRTGDRLMTPDYASPEQVRGERITTASDVYSLGVLLYELLADERPFRASGMTPGEIERAICTQAPKRPSTRAPKRGLAGDLDNIVLKAMHKEPARRYGSAAELSADIDRYLTGFPVNARPDSWTYRAEKFIRRHRVATTVAAILFLVISGLSIGLAIAARRASEEARASGQTTDFLVQLFNSSDPNETKGESLTVREVLDRGAARLETQLKDDPAVQARLLDTIGGIYDALGVWPRAEELIRKALALRRTRLSRDDMALANTLHELGRISHDLNQFDLCERSYREALSLYRKKLGDRDPRVAASLDDLGTPLFLEGRLGEAEALFRQSYELNRKTLGPGHEETLRAMNNLAVALVARGDLAAAEPLRREQVKLSIQSEGANAEPVAFGWFNLAGILETLGRLGEAEAAFRHAEAVDLKLYGAQNPVTAKMQADHAQVLGRLGRLDEANTMGAEALANTLKAVGPRNLDTAFSQDCRGSVLLALGKAAEARRLFQAAYDTRVALVGANHPDSAGSLMNLGRVDLATGQLQAAREGFQRALEVKQRLFGANSALAADSEVALADALGRSGDYAGAESRARRALAMFAAGSSQNPLATSGAKSALGWSLLRQNRPSEAKPLLEDAYSTVKNLYGTANVESARAAVRLAVCLRALGDRAQVRDLIASANSVLSRSVDPTARIEQEALQTLNATLK